MVVTPAYRLLLARRLGHACITLDLHTDPAPEAIGPAPERPHYLYEVQLTPAITCRA